MTELTVEEKAYEIIMAIHALLVQYRGLSFV